MYLELFSLFILILLSSFFSGSETAFMSVNRVKIKEKVQRGDEQAAKVDKLLHDQTKLLTTILIGNNLVNIAASSIATALSIELFGSKGVGIATGIVTLLILIFGEITPKTYSAYNSEKVAIKLGKPLEVLSVVFTPFLIVLNRVTKVIIKALGGNVNNNRTTVSEEEIKTLVDVGEEAGIIEKQEKEMINSIFEIGDIEVTEVMVPRIDIVYLEEDVTVEEAIKKVLKCGFSRIPVIKKSIDNITGIIYAKDLLACYFKQDKDESKGIRELIRPAYYVPESKKAIDLLTEMQLEKIHIAIVLDEYGGTLGLVTIEDILEEIVGDILDEYDEEMDLIDYLDEQTLIVNSKISIDEINETFKISLPEDEFESVGGLIFNLLGRIPKKGDNIEYNGLLFKILEVHNRRIKKVEISKINHKGDPK